MTSLPAHSMPRSFWIFEPMTPKSPAMDTAASSGDFSTTTTSAPSSAAAFAAAIACLLVPALLVRKLPSLTRVYSVALPVSAAGFLLLPLIWNAAGGDLASVSPEEALCQRCAVLAERYGFTPREGDIFLLLAQGHTMPAVSERLFVSESTVKSHVKRIYQKLGIHTRSELLDLVNEADV